MKRATLGILLIATTAAAGTPEAKSLVGKQLAGIDEARATFAANAVLVLPDRPFTGAMPKTDSDGFLQQNDISLDDGKLGKLTAGRHGDAMWIAAEIVQKYSLLDCPPALARCHKKRTLRISELVVGGTAVVAHVDDPVHAPSSGDTDAIEPATAAGPLSAMIADPKALAAALLDDPAVVVLGTELKERAVGAAAARKLLGSWSKLSLAIAGKPHEERTRTWGYAAANVDWTSKAKTVHMRATVFAVDVGGSWKVVAVHYSLPFHRYD